MKQGLVLIFVFCLFSLTWGSVVYQIFLKPPLIISSSDEAVIISNEDHKRALAMEEVAEEEIVPKKEVLITQTEKNKQSPPPLQGGIDYGEGISIDDVLNDSSIVMSN